MKRALLKKGLAATAAIGTVAGIVVAAAPAQAAPPPGTVIIAASGSDTTDDYMTTYLANPDPNGPGDNGRYNIRAKYGTGGAPNPTFVPGDANCAEDNTPTAGFNGITWGDGTAMGGSFTTKLAPNGSTAGREALKGYVNGAAADKGCIDVARSSSTPRTVPSDNATFQYNAFGLEVLGWASTSLFAPASLTQLQIYDIFKCNVRDWSQVGGGPARIQRMNIQPGSGTGDFFRSTFLGSSATSAIPSGITPDPSKGGPGNPTGICPDAPFMQENDASDVPASAYGFAIMPYSAGQWIFQANNFDNPTLDKRRGARLGLLSALSDGNAATRDSIQAISLNTTSGSPTVTSATKRFTNVNIGARITGNNIPANTTIVSVTDPFTAVLSNNATATGTDTNVFITSLPAAGAFWFKTGLGSWIPNTPFTSSDPDLTRPRGPVTEDEVTLNNPGASYLGVRYVFNVTDTASPNYAEANNLVGFVNVPSGAKSPICDGSESTAIRSKGFAPLSTTLGATVDSSRNLAGSTCRRYTP